VAARRAFWPDARLWAALLFVASTPGCGEEPSDADRLAGNKCPDASSGYSAQHDDCWASAVAFASRTPAVWRQLSAAEKTKIDWLMKAEAAACALSSADASNALRNTLDGTANDHPRGNVN
jgi:hypothetical protein